MIELYTGHQLTNVEFTKPSSTGLLDQASAVVKPICTNACCAQAGGAALPPRSAAAAVAIGKLIYVFGGQDLESGIAFNDIITLDTGGHGLQLYWA